MEKDLRLGIFGTVLQSIMSSNPIENRLSNISTNWEELFAAHEGGNSDLNAAKIRGQVLQRYSNCVSHYMFGATKSHHAAEELTQEFALRFIRGDFGKATPQQGRFRDYLKVSLRNLIADFYRKKAAEGAFVVPSVPIDTAAEISSLDVEFSENWRRRLLNITWEQLQSFEVEKANYYYAVLYLRSQNPEASSDELALEFTQRHSKVVSPDWIRQNLRRARRKFGELLIEEVGRTVNSIDRNDVDEEMASLGLKKYVAGLDL